MRARERVERESRKRESREGVEKERERVEMESRKRERESRGSRERERERWSRSSFFCSFSPVNKKAGSFVAFEFCVRLSLRVRSLLLISKLSLAHLESIMRAAAAAATSSRGSRATTDVVTRAAATGRGGGGGRGTPGGGRGPGPGRGGFAARPPRRLPDSGYFAEVPDPKGTAERTEKERQERERRGGERKRAQFR